MLCKFFDKRDSFPHSMAHIPKVELILTTLNQYWINKAGW